MTFKRDPRTVEALLSFKCLAAEAAQRLGLIDGRIALLVGQDNVISMKTATL